MNYCLQCEYYRKVTPFGHKSIEYCIKSESLYKDPKKCDKRLKIEKSENG